MKHTIKRYYDGVRLSPERKQKMLKDIVRRQRAERISHRATWKTMTVAAAVVIVALAIVLPIMLHDRGNAEDSVAASQSLPAEAGQVVSQETKSYTTAIVVSMNPDVEIRLDADGMVTEVVGLNEDGIALVEGIDFFGMTLENATIMVVNQLILQGYITAAEIEEEINISLSSETMTLDTLSVMTNIIETAASQQNIAVDVIQDAEANSVQVVLEGQGSPDVLEEYVPEEGIELGVEFVMTQGTYSAYVDNVLIHTREGEVIGNFLDFAGMEMNIAARWGIVELIEKGYISDAEGSFTRFYFTGFCREQDILKLAELTKLFIAEFNLKIAVIPDTAKKEIRLVRDDTITHEIQVSAYTIQDLLNFRVNIDEESMSPRQIAILKMIYNYREYQWRLEKRYYVVVPNLVGMTEEKAIELMQQLGLVPSVVREKVQGYDPESENGGAINGEYPVVDFGCVFYQDAIPGGTCQVGSHFQLNVVVPMDDERPEVLDYREDSGIVIRGMDVPFDVSGYPDTFLLSDAEGFDAMIREMNVTYTIENEADYTVTINRDTGWENTVIITIAHRDGFPMSKFLVQDGVIIEHEFLWRRDAPTAGSNQG